MSNKTLEGRSDISRIAQDSRYVEDRLLRSDWTPFGYIYQSASPSAPMVSVEITSSTPTAGYYDGRFRFLNPDGETPAWFSPTDESGSEFICKVIPLNSTDTLTQNRQYHGRLEGRFEDTAITFAGWHVVSVEVGDCGNVNTGCGLLIRVYNGISYVEVDYVQVAGNNVVTSLVGVATNSNTNDCGYLKFDKVPTSNTNENLVTSVTMSMVNGSLCLTTSHTTYRNFFNAAGVHVDRQVVANSNVDVVTCINTCLFADCCNTTGTVVATASADVVDINPGETVNFTGSASGGTPPYSYHWDFDDGTTSNLQNPSHTFNAVGVYNVVLTVTDACGWSDSDIVTITVHASVSTACCANVPGVLEWNITAITGECSCISTTTGRVVYNSGSSQWEWVNFACPLGVCEENAQWALACILGTWDYAGGLAPTSATCTPFSVVFNKSSIYGPGSYTITFTPP